MFTSKVDKIVGKGISREYLIDYQAKENELWKKKGFARAPTDSPKVKLSKNKTESPCVQTILPL